MSGIIAVYGLVVAVLIAGSRMSLCFCCGLIAQSILAVKPGEYSLFAGFIHLGAGLACGFTGMAAGYAIGIVGDSVGFLARPWNAKLKPLQCLRAYLNEAKMFVTMVLILIFAEVIGLYG